MNAVMERWIQTCRCELLDRMLIWNEAWTTYCTRYASSSGTTTNIDPCARYPNQSPTLTNSLSYAFVAAIASAASCTSMNTRPDLRGRSSRH